MALAKKKTIKKTNTKLKSLDIQIDTKDKKLINSKIKELLMLWIENDDLKGKTLDDFGANILYGVDDLPVRIFDSENREKELKHVDKRMKKYLESDPFHINEDQVAIYIEEIYTSLYLQTEETTRKSHYFDILDLDELEKQITKIVQKIINKDINSPVFDWFINIEDLEEQSKNMIFISRMQKMMRNEKDDDVIWSNILSKESMVKDMATLIMSEAIDCKKPIVVWNLWNYADKNNLDMKGVAQGMLNNQKLGFIKDKEKDESLIRAILLHPKEQISKNPTDYVNLASNTLCLKNIPTHLGYEIIDKTIKMIGSINKITKFPEKIKAKQCFDLLTDWILFSNNNVFIEKLFEYKDDKDLGDIYSEKLNYIIENSKDEKEIGIFVKNSLSEKETETLFEELIEKSKWDRAEMLIPHLLMDKVSTIAWKGIWSSIKRQAPALGALLERDKITEEIDNVEILSKTNKKTKRKI